MFEIAKEIIDQATKPDRSFGCLTKIDQPNCKISYCVSGKVHFLESCNRYCNCRLAFAGETICMCPGFGVHYKHPYYREGHHMLLVEVYRVLGE